MTITETCERVLELDAKASHAPWHVSTNRHPTTDGEQWGSVDWKRHPAGGAGAYPSGMTITWRGNHGRTNAAAVALYRTAAPLLATEVLRLAKLMADARKAIEDAPHVPFCHVIRNHGPDANTCTCWKSRALAQLTEPSLK